MESCTQKGLMSLVWHYVIVCLCFFSWTNPETDRQTDRLSTEELKGTVANVPSHTPSQETVPSSAVLDGISAPISLTHQHWPRCSQNATHTPTVSTEHTHTEKKTLPFHPGLSRTDVCANLVCHQRRVMKCVCVCACVCV